mmetsp:Transcript_72/g.195  ORF Transcript_72/g.195 Transcript_72/m.195 type:complete len:146 (+) Transcript_72:452-889(+)
MICLVQFSVFFTVIYRAKWCPSAELRPKLLLLDEPTAWNHKRLVAAMFSGVTPLSVSLSIVRLVHVTNTAATSVTHVQKASSYKLRSNVPHKSPALQTSLEQFLYGAYCTRNFSLGATVQYSFHGQLLPLSSAAAAGAVKSSRKG